MATTSRPLRTLHDFKTWAEEGPPKGTIYNYPPRGDVIASISGAPAPTRIGNQIFAQATMTKMIAQCTQQAQVHRQGDRLGRRRARRVHAVLDRGCNRR